jgi:hypothetical protein
MKPCNMGIWGIIRMDDETPTIVNMGAIFLQAHGTKFTQAKTR